MAELMAELKEGSKAPVIDAKTDEGGTFRLSDYLGKRVVLYFYPKADTPG
jgi:thioredoxin-dependent peroxiredoxin